MGTEITTGLDPDLTMQCWPDLLRQPITSAGERDAIAGAIRQLSTPADPTWVLARVAALLTAYYVADVPARIVQIEADDWAAELREYPDWAITKAARWWKGANNPDRRKKPFPGDIAVRARLEMGALVVAKGAVDRFDRGAAMYHPPPPRDVPDLAERQRIAQEVIGGHYTYKRMDQSA